MLHAELNVNIGGRYFFETKYEGTFEAIVEFYSEPMGALELSILDYENSQMEEPRTYFLDEIKGIYDENGNVIFGDSVPFSKIQVGNDGIVKKSIAQKLMERLKLIAKKEKRLGRYEMIEDGKSYKFYHILEGEEIQLARERCKQEGHSVHADFGYCVKCHLRVEDK
jgi:hypothetical protein